MTSRTFCLAMDTELKVYLPTVLVNICKAYHVPLLDIDVPGNIEKQHWGIFGMYCDGLIEGDIVYYITHGHQSKLRIMRKEPAFVETVASIKKEIPFYYSDNKHQLYLNSTILRSYFKWKMPIGEIIVERTLAKLSILSIIKHKNRIYLLTTDTEKYTMMVYNIRGQLVNDFVIGSYEDSIGNFVIHHDIIYIVIPSIRVTKSRISTILKFSLNGDRLDQQKFIASEEEAIMFFDILTIVDDRLYAINSANHQMAELLST